MLILGIILLIVFGLILLIVELFIIPGISIAGIGSALFFLAGIFISFKYIGSQAGFISLLAIVISVAIALYYAFKPKTWNRIALKKDIDGKSSDFSYFDQIKVGDIGVCISRMAPMGEVEINGFRFEAQSVIGFIDVGVKIQVVGKHNNKILIKSL